MTREMDKKYCTIEFDGASKENPRRAGSGVLLCDSDGTVISSYREGLGNTTTNVAEHRGLIRGLESALEKGYTHVMAYGDSQLVVKQMRGEWKLTSLKMVELHNQAKEFTSQFKSFDIEHIPRDYNSEADSHANYRANLQDGQTQVIAGRKYY